MCFDEAAKQILGETREPLPMGPGRGARVDGEYTRHRTAALFMAFEPLAGTRSVFVRERRTALDFAQVIRHLVDVVYPEAAGSCWCWTP